MMSRRFSPSEAHGGESPTPHSTALLLIDFQNEFTTEGGKMHEAVRECMNETSMLCNAKEVSGHLVSLCVIK